MMSNNPGRTVPVLGLALLFSATALAPANAGTFNNNFNTDPSGAVTIAEPAKWVESGGVGGTGYISLTDAVASQNNGTIIIDDLDNGAAVGGFRATFKFQVGQPSGNSADGWSFNFADDLAASMGEEGSGTGLTVAFDTYDNGGAEAPAVDIKVGGNVVQSKKLTKAEMQTGNDFADVRIEYNNGLLNVDFKGASIYKDLPVGVPPISGGSFGIGARTGGEWETHWIDDLSIQTFLLTTPTIAAVPANAKGITIVLQDAPNAAVDATSVAAMVDGVAVTGTATKAGDRTTYNFVSPTIYAPGSVHPVVLTYKYGAAATPATNSFSVTVPSYILIPATAALPAGAVDTTKRGFTWRVHQADSPTELPNSVSRAENQLAGLLGANIADRTAVGAASGPATAPTPATAPMEFAVPGVINFSQTEGEENGNVTPDLQMPGFAPGDHNNIAAEILTALEFPAAGTYSLIVNSDDGFRTTAGRNPRAVTNPTLGIFNAGRGASDTAFNIYVEAPGLYGFRTIWFEGGGGANIELLSVTQDGSKVLLNDPTNPQAIKTYQLSASTLPAFVRSVTPAVDATMINRPKTVEAVLVDGGSQVTANSVTLKLNGANAAVTSTKTGAETRVVHTVVGDLQPSTVYTAELIYADSAGSHTNTWSFTTGPLSSTLFVIEAEDFDYDSGQANPKKGETGLDVDVMPYLGGAYEGLGAVEGVDYNNGDANDGSIYREETDEGGENEVSMATRDNIAAGNGKGGTIPINSSDRGSYTTTRNFGIGWVGGGDWQNYTRTFPDNGMGGWWRVYAGLSYGGDGDGQLAGSLSRVTAGAGTADQTVESIGTFAAPGSGGWGNNNLVAMQNASGGAALVKLIGKNTVRFNMSSGDFDFLIFSAAPPPPPFVESAPQDSVGRTAAILDFVLRDTDSKVNASTIKVFIDGNDVTAKTTSAKTATGATVHVDLTGTTLEAGQRPWRITFSDDSNPAQNVTAEGTFAVNPYPAQTVFVIEAEDFNYSDDGVTGGKTNPKKGEADQDVDVMPYLGGAYADLAAVEGVDYNNNDANDSDAYRTEKDENGENEVNITASNGNRFSNDRGAFELTSNYRIGWVEGGSWQNYTRTFPKGDYNVWAALSFDGRGNGQLSGSLDEVTSDPTKPNQTTRPLGTFSAPGSGGWGRNELVPMKGTNGATAVVSLEGTKTLRFNLGSGDFDYLVFIPGTAAPPTGGFTSVAKSGNNLMLAWNGGILESANEVDGPYTPVAGVTSPATIPITGTQKFYRLRQ